MWWPLYVFNLCSLIFLGFQSFMFSQLGCLASLSVSFVSPSHLGHILRVTLCASHYVCHMYHILWLASGMGSFVQNVCRCAIYVKFDTSDKGGNLSDGSTVTSTVWLMAVPLAKNRRKCRKIDFSFCKRHFFFWIRQVTPKILSQRSS